MKKIALFLFRLAIFFEICWGAHAWFTWWCDLGKTSAYFTLFTLFFIALFYKMVFNIQLSFSPKIIMAFVCFIVAEFFRSQFSVLGTARYILSFFPVWVLLSDDNDNVIEHLDFLLKTMAIIMAIGMVEYFLSLVITIPSSIISYGEHSSYIFLNYGFYLRNIGENSFLDEFQRFSSVFVEPGYVSVMLVFLLFASEFRLSKRENRILLYATLLSFSLAGYVLLFLAYMFYRFIKNKKIWGLFLIGLIVGGVYQIAINYNGGNNRINKAIVERLTYDEEKGISGNNRTSDVTRYYFERGLKNGDIILGLGIDKVNRINGKLTTFSNDAIAGTGATYFFVVYGILSSVFFLLFYYSLSIYCINKRYSLFFVILIIACFIQASYPDSPSWIYPFALGIKTFGKEQSNNTRFINESIDSQLGL